MDVLARESEMGLRGLARIAWAAGAAMAATSVAAEELTSFVDAQKGARGCWSRQYSAEHLAAHPDQLVTAMDFTMQLDGEFHYFELTADLRGGQSGSAAGACSEYEGVVSCGVDCDGGGVVLRHGADGKVLLDLSAYGYIRMTNSCGEDEEDGFALEAGRDDKEFLLSPASGKACKPLAWAN
jgi:hypothetical protein